MGGGSSLIPSSSSKPTGSSLIPASKPKSSAQPTKKIDPKPSAEDEMNMALINQLMEEDENEMLA